MRLRLLLLILGAGAYLTMRWVRAVWAAFVYPTPAAASWPMRSTDCSFPSTGSPVLAAVDSSTTGGFHTAPVIVVDASVRMRLDSSLTLIADDRLEMNGKIMLDPTPGVAVNIALVCRNGPVVIGASGKLGIGYESASAGRNVTVQDPNADARAGAGSHAGAIKLIALQGSIDVQGEIKAHGGGHGGNASATGVASPWPWGPQGRALAAGGQGGAGGDVVLCALEAINIAGEVIAGPGGRGGAAHAHAIGGESAEAVAGPANDSGSVYFHGLDPSCQVFLNARVSAPDGGNGGSAEATGGAGTTGSPGGDARAEAGTGGVGGTVRFLNCAAAAPGTVFSGDAGEGGRARAAGGVGGPAGAGGTGGTGGYAEAWGGDAGFAGAVVVIPLTNGSTATGNGPSGAYSGERATATAGDGGPGGVALWGRPGAGGTSGQGFAQGGAGERTRRRPTPAMSPPVAPAAVPGALPGGVAVSAVSRGSP